jgi:hypothetical protein
MKRTVSVQSEWRPGISDLAILAGLAVFGIGLWLIWAPLLYLVAGLFLVFIGMRLHNVGR